MERKEIIHQKQRNKATTILACTEDYSRLTRLIGRLVMHQPHETVYLESLLPVSCKTATSRSGSKTHNYACKLKHTIMHASYLVRAAKIHALLSKHGTYTYILSFL